MNEYLVRLPSGLIINLATVCGILNNEHTTTATIVYPGETAIPLDQADWDALSGYLNNNKSGVILDLGKRKTTTSEKLAGTIVERGHP